MSDITETMTVKNGQAAVKTVTVAGKLSPKTSATDTIALVETSDGKQAALKVYNINGGGGGGGDYDAVIEALENAVSVLTTSVELSTEIGETTVVLLDELLTLDVDGRPDYKAPGATVYAENGVTGIIDTIDDSAQTAVVKTVSVSTGGGELPDNVLVNNGDVNKKNLAVAGNVGSYNNNTVLGVGSSSYGGDNNTVVGAGSQCRNGSTLVGANIQSSTARGAVIIGSGENPVGYGYSFEDNSLNWVLSGVVYKLFTGDGAIFADRLPNILEIEEF